MNARLPLWTLGIAKIHLSLLDLAGQIVLNRDIIKQNSSAELCLCYKMSWTSPAAAGEEWLDFVGLHLSPHLWRTEKSLRNLAYLISVPYCVWDRWATEFLTTWFVGKREISYNRRHGVQMQEVALKWSKGLVCRCVVFECVGALGKQWDVTDKQFRCLKSHCQTIFKKMVLLKML